jgi:hypothetical protein
MDRTKIVKALTGRDLPVIDTTVNVSAWEKWAKENTMTGKEYIKMWADRVAIRIEARNKQRQPKHMNVQPPRPLPLQYQLWKLVDMLESELRGRGHQVIVSPDTPDGVVKVRWE